MVPCEILYNISRNELHDKDPVKYAENLIQFLGPLRQEKIKHVLTFSQLRNKGNWTYVTSSGLKSWMYLRPGIEKLKENERIIGKHMFESEEKTIEWALKHKIDFNTRFGHIDEDDAIENEIVDDDEDEDGSYHKDGEEFWRDPLEQALEGDAGIGSIESYGASGGYEVIIIMIHSLDGNATLRNHQTQYALSLLAASPRIRFIVSVDHINAALMWDIKISEQYSWIWQEATTHITYDLEGIDLLETHVHSHYKTKKVQISEKIDESIRDSKTILGILSNLTLKHKQILAQIAIVKNGNAVTFTELFAKCKAILLYMKSDENLLKNCLQELRDQRLITESNKFKVDESTLPILKARHPEMFPN